MTNLNLNNEKINNESSVIKRERTIFEKTKNENGIYMHGIANFNEYLELKESKKVDTLNVKVKLSFSDYMIALQEYLDYDDSDNSFVDFLKIYAEGLRA